MKIVGLAILWMCMLAGCSKKKVELTTEYIINPSWNDQANAIEINKMKLRKDSVISDINNLSKDEVLRKLEEDKSFAFVGNVKPNGTKYSIRKVYFNRDNGFPWWTDNGNAKQQIIGNLQKNNWYKFSHLVTYPYYIYVYIDSANKLHRFDLNLANY